MGRNDQSKEDNLSKEEDDVSLIFYYYNI